MRRRNGGEKGREGWTEEKNVPLLRKEAKERAKFPKQRFASCPRGTGLSCIGGTPSTPYAPKSAIIELRRQRETSYSLEFDS